MHRSKPLMMLMTGIVLALLLWGAVSLLSDRNTNDDTRTAVIPPVSLDTQSEDERISPARILSVMQISETFTLKGSGISGAGLTLYHKDKNLGSTKINADGQWEYSSKFDLFDPKFNGDAIVIKLLMVTPNGHQVRSDQSLILVKGRASESNAKEEDEENENAFPPQPERQIYEKILILLSTPGGRSHVLQTQFSSLLSREGFELEAIDYDNSGGVIFSGSSTRQGKVSVFANTNLVGESYVDALGRWSLIFGNIMPMGSYNISVELLSSVDQKSTKLTFPFARMRPLFESENSPEVLVEYLGDRIQIGRVLYGGGYQFTVVYSGQALQE